VVAVGGTAAWSVVAVDVVTVAGDAFRRKALSDATVSKFVPVTVSSVPAAIGDGETPLIVGPAAVAVTTKGALVSADPLGVVTVIGPVDAPDGTVVTRVVGQA
jgi:hypothetical protein